MKKTVALIAAALALCACGTPEAEINPVAKALQDAVAEGKYYYGHQDDLMYGHTWNATLEADHSQERSDVLDVCGAYPGVLGLDLGEIELGGPCNIDGNDFGLMREAAIKHHERGGIVTLSWHMRNPKTGGDAWDNSDSLTVASILEGGENHDKLLGWLDAGADFIASLKDADGKHIPIIFRPWHEHSGRWFWWGSKTTTPEQYNELWRMTYDYLVDVKGLKDMVWAISPNGKGGEFDAWMSRYPGDEYVDIIGLDYYMNTGIKPYEAAVENYMQVMKEALTSLQKMCGEHGKILAVCETGYESIPDPAWWTEVMMKAVEGFPVSYVLTWRNASDEAKKDYHFYGPWKGQASEDNFKEFADNEKTIFLK